MSHIVAKETFKSLEDRLNKFPQGVPPSETLYKILSVLYTEEEAALVAKLPIRPFNISMASKIWNVSLSEAEFMLESLASKALILDTEYNGERKFVIPPPMAGFFEFALMRVRGDIDQKLLSKLFYQYLNVEEDFIKDLFLGTETRFGRVLISEDILPETIASTPTPENSLYILDYERATYLIKNAKHISLSMCYCRHKMHHLGKDCSKPMDTCLTFDSTAYSLIKNGYGRKIDSSECIDILNMCYENNLVQCGENVRNEIGFLCNCCCCCCEGLKAVKKYGALHPIATTNFLPYVNNDSCIGCGKCTKICPIEVISLKNKKASIDESICLGCGVCVRNCPTKAIKLKTRSQRILTPANTTHRVIIQAIEKGNLQNLIFDNQAFASHRFMASVLSTILNANPIKQALASKQFKSIYLDKLISKKYK